jgi:hypothetical protein
VHECTVCSAKVSELRRGRCWGCYARWVDARPVGLNAQCITCDEKRRHVLRNVEIFGGWRPMCFNCSGQVASITPMPRTLTSLRDLLSRERRRRDRRIGRSDTRVFQYERRAIDRRDGRAPLPIDDEMIIEITFQPPSFDPDDDVDFDDITAIRELVRDLRPDPELALSAVI